MVVGGGVLRRLLEQAPHTAPVTEANVMHGYQWVINQEELRGYHIPVIHPNCEFLVP